MRMILAGLIAYLFGSINTSILVAKLSANIDIRNYGSGNAGATNTLRTLGKAAAAIVLAGDILKGVIGVLIGGYLAGEAGCLIAGIACVVGHNYPVFFRFKGGKGILTSATVVTMVDWKAGVLLIVLAIGIMAVTKYVSLGSMIGAGLYPVITLFTKGYQSGYLIFAFCIAILAIYRHKTNIKRLLSGTESKLGSKVKVKE